MNTTLRAAAVVAICLAPAFASAANPTANAGADQTIAYGSLPALVTLSGSGSDPDGGSITAYSWTTVDVPPSSTATLSASNVASPTFTADLPGTYRFCLQVTDSDAETNGTTFIAQPTAACTNVMVTTEHEALVKPAKGQRNTWDLVNAWADALDALRGEHDTLITDLADTTATSEGALMVGTDTKTNLNNADNVEEALTYLDTVLTTTGPYLPLAGGTLAGDVLVSLDDQFDFGTTSAAWSAIYARTIGSTGNLGLDAASAGTINIGATLASKTNIGRAAGSVYLVGNVFINATQLTATATEINQALDGIGASVTAANLTTLTDGSDAAALHTHSTYLDLAGGTMTGNILWSTDNARAIGSTTAAAATLYARTINNGTGTTLTIQGANGSTGVNGDALRLWAGDAAAASGATPASTAGGLFLSSGDGGAADGATAGTDAGAISISGGRGGDGSAGSAATDGGDVSINGGPAGTDNGGGAGTAGAITIGTSEARAISIGKGGVTTTVAGTANLSGTFQLAGVTVNATAAELNTLRGGASSNADALHRHAVPALIATDRGQVTASASAVSASAVAQWSIPLDTATITVRCTGWCVASAADDANCSLRFTDEAGTTIVDAAIPAAECGASGTTIANAQSYEVTFATSALGSDTFGEIYVVSASGTSDCKIGRLGCWAY